MKFIEFIKAYMEMGRGQALVVSPQTGITVVDIVEPANYSAPTVNVAAETKAIGIEMRKDWMQMTRGRTLGIASRKDKTKVFVGSVESVTAEVKSFMSDGCRKSDGPAVAKEAAVTKNPPRESRIFCTVPVVPPRESHPSEANVAAVQAVFLANADAVLAEFLAQLCADILGKTSSERSKRFSYKRIGNAIVSTLNGRTQVNRVIEETACATREVAAVQGLVKAAYDGDEVIKRLRLGWQQLPKKIPSLLEMEKKTWMRYLFWSLVDGLTSETDERVVDKGNVAEFYAKGLSTAQIKACKDKAVLVQPFA